YDNVQWVGFQSKVFQHLDFADIIPDALDLITNPLQYFEHLHIVMTNNDARRAKVGTGLHPSDHRRIYAALNERLEAVAIPTAPWQRAAAGELTSKYRSLSHEQEKKTRLTDREKRHALAQISQLPARIELHVNSQEAHAFKEHILHTVGMLHAYRGQLHENPLRVNLNGRPILEIEVMKNPELTNTVTNTSEAGKTQHRNTIAKMYPKAQAATGSLITLPDYRGTQQWKSDPKELIRVGLADNGRVTQFITPIGGDKNAAQNYRIRQKGAVLDLLRWLGFRFNPYHQKAPTAKLPDQLDILGFWLFQLNARKDKEKTVYLPVMVEALYGQHRLQVTLPNNVSGATIYPTMREALCAAAAYDADYADMGEAVSFYRQAVAKRRSNNPALLLIADQNLQRAFDELKTQTVSTVTLHNILTEGQAQIRVARLRFSHYDEAPFCATTAPRSKYNGLYYHPSAPNVFFSLHDVGNLHISSTKQKLQAPEATANPSTVQIWMNNLQAGDDAEAFAHLIHRLRKESSHSTIATVLPQPLHDTMGLTDYVQRFVKGSGFSDTEADPADMDEENSHSRLE
ncbi:MAG: DUF3893 domain-containing protein, partial [Anaerolineae bacterium]|nr:DUF3893 domain-containing protein [Anaerolineae bacterium]